MAASDYGKGLVGRCIFSDDKVDEPRVVSYLSTWVVVVPDGWNGRIVAEVETEALGLLLLERLRQ